MTTARRTLATPCAIAPAGFLLYTSASSASRTAAGKPSNDRHFDIVVEPRINPVDKNDVLFTEQRCGESST